MEIHNKDRYFNLIYKEEEEKRIKKEEEKRIKKERKYFMYDIKTVKHIWKEEIEFLQYPIRLFEKYGNKGYIGEEVTQLQHAIQAALLAEDYYYYVSENKRIELVLGAFLHDVGHLLIFEDNLLEKMGEVEVKGYKEIEKMGEVGVKDHEELGAEFLREFGYPNLIYEIVRKHILTKRYLITTRDGYYDKLSEASKETFKYQGGKLTEEEINNFEKDEYFDYHLRMREFDDKAKSTHPNVLKRLELLDPINYYKDMVERYVILYYL